MRTRLFSNRIRTSMGVIALLALLLVLEWTGAVNSSQTVDEGAHLAAGYTYLVTGDFRMNPEHPPLLKELAALPLLLLPIHAPLNHSSWHAGDEWDFGRQFLYHNTVSAQTILLAGRFPIMLLTLCLGLLVFVWSKKHFGVWGGLLSLGLLAFEPTTIAHGQLVTTDLGFTFFFLLTIWICVRYIEHPTLLRALLLGLTLGAAQAAKFSSLFLWLIIPLLIAGALVHPDGSRLRTVKWKTLLGHSALIFVSSFVLLWSTYGFEIRTLLSHPRIAQLREEIPVMSAYQRAHLPAGTNLLLPLANEMTPLGRSFLLFADRAPLPLVTYLRGIGSVVAHNATGHGSYIHGMSNTPDNRGWWWYFPYAVGVKGAAGMLLLLPLGFMAMQRRFRVPTHSAKLWFERLPFSLIALGFASMFFFAISLFSNINLGIRHVLVSFPTLIIFLGSLAPLLASTRSVAVKFGTATLILWIPITTIAAHPQEIAYFNEFAGGMERGHEHLLDSNLDWGQDLIRLQHYLQKHPPTDGILRLAYFGSAEVQYFFDDLHDFPSRLAPQETPPPGTYAISMGILHDWPAEFDWLFRYMPTAKVGASIMVYDFPAR